MKFAGLAVVRLVLGCDATKKTKNKIKIKLTTKGIFSEGDRFPLFALQRSSTRRLGGPGAPRSVASEAQHGSTGLLSLTAKLSVPMADEKMVQLLREVGLDASVEEKFKQVWVRQPAPRGTRNGCDCHGQRRSYGVLVLVRCAGVSHRAWLASSAYEWGKGMNVLRVLREYDSNVCVLGVNRRTFAVKPSSCSVRKIWRRWE